MSVDFVVPQWGQCTADQVLRNLRPADQAHTARIDLKSSTWCDPAGLVAIAAFAEAQSLAGRWVELARPSDLGRANYLTRMHLGRVLDELGCYHNLKAVRETAGLELLELRRFEGEDGAADLAALVYNKTEGDRVVADALYRSLGEIGGNVSQHSGRPHGYMAAIMTYGGRRIEFAVADAGSGLTANLARVGSTGDAHSLEMVLDHGVSSTGELGRGNGIRDTRRLVTGLNGQVSMITRGAGRIVQRNGAIVLSGQLPFPGTLLQGSLDCR